MEINAVLILLFLSAVVGGIFVTVMQKSQNGQLIKLLLAFSGGFLLSIAFIHFIPELYEAEASHTGIYILVGFLIQLLLEFFSGGIEHGHIHIHKGAKVPVGLIIALCLHCFLEGIPLGSQMAGHEIATSHQHGNDNSLLLGILLHRVPVAIALMTLLLSSNLTMRKSWVILLIFAITSPIGALFGYSSDMFSLHFDFNIILSIVVGMFLHISTTIIFETSENHKFNFMKLITIFTGCALAFFVH